MEISWLAKEAVLLIGPVGAAVLVVAAVRSRVTGSVPGTRELILLTGRTVQLVPTVGAMPVAVTALLLRVTAPVAPAGQLPGQTEAFHLIKGEPSKPPHLNLSPEAEGRLQEPTW